MTTLHGFGIGLRAELLDELELTTRSIDWLEIIAENWIDTGGPRLRQLERLAERWPLVPHSVTLSIGGPDPLDGSFFRKMTELCRRTRAPFWSDHVCWAARGGAYYNDLLPLPFSAEALEHVLRRVDVAKTLTDVPLVFENPTYYVRMPGGAMSEAAFLKTIAEESGCGLLLDVNNVYVNSENLGFDPERLIAELPLDRVAQIHLAGHTRLPDVVLDSHIGPIVDRVWSLYRYTLRRAGRLIPTLIEWDQEIPSLDAVLDEMDRARAEADAALGSPVPCPHGERPAVGARGAA